MPIKLKHWFYILLIISMPVFAKPVLNIQHWVTKNGARVLFVETHELPILDIQVTFNAGSARDDNKFGIAQFVNAMLDQRTKTLTADQIAAAFDQVGAQFEAAIDRDMATVSLRSLTDRKLLNPALDTFTKVLTEPIFPQQAFQRVQKQILSSITEEQQQPLIIAKNAFYQNLYGNLAYGHSILGTGKFIRALTPQDLQAFYRKYYVAKNAVVAMVGDITLSQAKDIAKQVLNKLPSGQAASKLPSAPHLTKAKSQHINFPSAQTNVFIGQIGIARNDPDFFPLLVGNYILGQSPLTSQLFQEVRNKRGLAYSVGSSFAPLQTQGPFYIVLQTRTKQAKQAIRIAQQTLAKFVQQCPTEKQLKSAKQGLIGRFPLQLAGNENILSNLSLIGFYQLPLDYLDIYRKKISTVTLRQIQKAFKRHIQSDKMLIITVG